MHLLAHRGIVLLEPALLPALVPDAWQDAPRLDGVRLVRAQGLIVAPTEDPPGAVGALAAAGAAALFYVGSCASPSRALEPGDVLVVERARSRLGEVGASAPLATKLARRCASRGLAAQVGTVASGMPARQEDLGEDARSAEVLRAARDAGVPAGALLVCLGADAGVSEAPAAVLEAMDGLFEVLQGVLAREPG
jgi:hypothetical protein